MAHSHVYDLHVSELLHACGAGMQHGASPCMTLLLISASHHALLTLSTGVGRGRISLLSLFPTGVNPHTDMQTAHTLTHKHLKRRDDK